MSSDEAVFRHGAAEDEAPAAAMSSDGVGGGASDGAVSSDGSGGADGAPALRERIGDEFGDALAGFHIAGYELWVRIHRDAWADLAAWLRRAEDFAFFNFLSAIDWMPSPFGRDMDSAVDNAVGASDVPGAAEAPEASREARAVEAGVAGGDTRFQVLARVNDVRSHRSVIAKADMPEDDLRAPSWVPVYPGADWHEREAWEMFGIDFEGHPGLRHLYLPGEFEGNPLRKDYPLLSRRVKPWPGLVDVELMPAEDDC